MTTIAVVDARPRASRARSPPPSRPEHRCARVRRWSGARRAARTFVASSRPPRPASTTATSTWRSANSARAAAVIVSNCVAARPRRRAGPCDRHLEVGVVAADRIRSDQPCTCGETWSRPRARRRAEAPRRRASPSTCRSSRRRGSRGRLLRIAERGEQGAHAVEAEAVRRPGRERREPACPSPDTPRAARSAALDSRARRARGGSARASRARPRRRPAGAFATKRSFASIPSARAISFRRRSRSASTSPFACDPLGPDDGGEDPLLVAVELDAGRRCGGRSAAASWTRSSASAAACVAVVRLGPRRDDQARLASEAATRSPRSRAA